MKNKKFFNLFFQIIILLIAVLIFYRYHFGGNAFVPFDSKDQVYPYSVFVSQSYRSGEIPLWNPYIYSGTPSYADPLYMTFYPGTLLFLIPEFLGQHYFDYVELLHVFFGGLFIFLLLNDYKLNKWASLTAAIIFMLGGPLTGRIQHVTQISAVSLFPSILFFIHLGIKKQKLFWFGLSGFILGCALMIGYQPALLFCFIVLVYFVVENYSQHRLIKSNTKTIIFQFGFLVIMVIGCALIQVLPILQFAQHSSRPEFTYSDATAGSVPPSTLFTFIFPNLFNSIEGEYWGPIDVTEGYLFNGVIPLFIILFSLLSWKKANNIHKTFLVVLFISLFYSLGKYTPIFPILFKVFPPIRLFRRPSDALFIFQLGVAISVGFGLDLFFKELNQSYESTQKKLLFFVFVYIILVISAQSTISVYKPQTLIDDWYFSPNLIPLIAIFLPFILKNSQRTHLLFALAFVCIFVDITISSSNRWFNSTSKEFVSIDKNSVYGCSEIVRFLEEGLDDNYRYEAINAGSMWFNSSAIWKIPSSLGYSPLIVNTYNDFSNPLNVNNYRDFSGFIEGYNSPLFDLLGVKYVITNTVTMLDDLDPQVDSSQFTKVSSACNNVFENTNPIPLVYFVDDIIYLEQNSLYEYFSVGPYYDPREVVVLENIPAKLIDEYSLNENNLISLNKDAFEGTIDIKEKTNNKLILQSSSNNDGVLVLNDVNYPGWHVFIDGVEEELLVTNYAFKGVYVTPGEHTIEFVFDPPLYKIGLLIYLSCMTSLLLCFSVETFRKSDIPKKEN